MSSINKIKALFSAVKSIFEEMKSAQSDKGMVYWEDDLEVGTVLFTDEGVASDGDYVIMDFVYTVKDGIVTEVKPNNAEAPAPEPEPEPNAEMGCGNKNKMEDDVVVEEIPVEETVVEEPVVEEPVVEVEYVTKEDLEEIKNAIANIMVRLDEIVELRDRITAVDSRVTDIEGKPASGMPQDEFKKVVGDLSGIEAVKAMRKASRIK